MEELNKIEVCKMLKCSMSTLNRIMKKGLINYYKYGETKQARIMFLFEDVVEYRNKHSLKTKGVFKL